MHDGSKLYLKKVAEDYDPDRQDDGDAAAARDRAARRVRDRRPLRRAGQGRLHQRCSDSSTSRSPPCRSSACGRAEAVLDEVMESPALMRLAVHSARDRLCLPPRCLLASRAAALAGAQGKRPLAVDDLYNVRDVRDPQRSPDGKWVAYTVTRAIRDTDKNDTDVWMVSWDGREQIQLTSTPDSESRPRWSPDGKYPVVRLVAPGRQAARRSGCSTAPAGKRSSSPTSRAASPTTPGRPTASASSLVVDEPDPQRPAEDDKSQESDAGRRRRSRSSSIATTSSPTSAATSAASARTSTCSTSRRRRPSSLTPGAFDETSPGVVARRHADRVHPPPSRRRRRRQGCRTATCSSSTRAPARSRGG